MIKNYCFFGERHSGTNFLEVFLKKNLNLKEKNIKFKHWFDVECAIEQKNTNNTLFFFIVRNPYDWIYAMKKKPYHFARERDKLGWDDFLKEEWYSVTNNRWQTYEIMEDRNWMTGERYDNILKMRTGKLYLINFLTKILRNTYVFRFEDFRDNNLIERKLKNIAYLYNLKLFPYHSDFAFNEYKRKKSVVDHINHDLDWTAESIFGYSPKLS